MLFYLPLKSKKKKQNVCNLYTSILLSGVSSKYTHRSITSRSVFSYRVSFEVPAASCFPTPHLPLQIPVTGKHGALCPPRSVSCSDSLPALTPACICPRVLPLSHAVLMHVLSLRWSPHSVTSQWSEWLCARYCSRGEGSLAGPGRDRPVWLEHQRGSERGAGPGAHTAGQAWDAAGSGQRVVPAATRVTLIPCCQEERGCGPE